MNISEESKLIWEAYATSSTRAKYGDIIPAIEIVDQLKFIIRSTNNNDTFGSDIYGYFDPTEGGGGQQPSTLYDKKIEELAKSLKISEFHIKDFFTTWIHNMFIPKCKKLADIALAPDMIKPRKDMTPEEREKIKEVRYSGIANKLYPYIGLAVSPESYRLLVGDAWDRLPDCVIGSTEWDYSFHGGDGRVNSFIAAIGSSEQEVRRLLELALKNIKAEYVGSSTEAKFRQRYQVREGD